MSPEEAVARLDALNGEPEADHGEADDVLLAVVPSDVAAAYRRVVERSAWWACA